MITRLYLSSEIDRCIRTCIQRLGDSGAQLFDDFKQELFLILAEKGEAFLMDLESRRNGAELNYYIVSIIVKLCRQTNNVIHRQYLPPAAATAEEFNFEKATGGADPFEDDTRLEDRMNSEAWEAEVVEKINSMDNTTSRAFFLKNVAELVAEHGSQRKVGQLTGIHHTAIHRAIKELREDLLNDRAN